MNLSYIINLKRIDFTEWEKCFEQLVKIVSHYPVTLMRMRIDECMGIERKVWTKEVIYSKNGTDTIQIKGDLYTMEWGSTYTIYKEADKHIISDEKESTDYSPSPFWLNPDGEYFNCSPGYKPFDLFKNYDTCGAPYSYAVLAFGIYLEHCFYRQSYLTGDFSPKQIQLVMSWLEDLLDEKIKLPKSLHQLNLWNELQQVFDNPIDAITRFWFLSARTAADKIAFLLEHDKDNTNKFLIGNIRTYTSVDQLGVIDILLPYLQAVGDLEVFISFFKKVQKANKHENFNLNELLRLLIKQGVCEKPFDNEVIRKYHEESGLLETGMESLNRVFLKMGGMPESRNFFTTPEELLEIFAYDEPENGKQFSETITKEVSIAAKKRNDINEKLEEAVLRISETMEEETEPVEDGIRRRHLASEDYFIGEAKSQKRPRASEEVAKFVANDISKKLQEYEEKYGKKYFKYASSVDLQKQLYAAILERGLGFTENVWNEIDLLDDNTILEGLLHFALIREREMKFWNLRKDFFESPQYWHHFKSMQ